MRPRAAFAALSLLIAACGGSPGDTTTRASGPPSTIDAGATTTLDPRPCHATTVIAPRAMADGSPAVRRLAGGNPQAAAVATSQAMFGCAADVVVVDGADLGRTAMAATLAAAFDAPLLFGSEGATGLLDYELERLAPERLWLVGDLAAADPPEWTEIERIGGTDDEIAAEIAGMIGASTTLTMPPGDERTTLAMTIAAIDDGASLVPTTPTTPPSPFTVGDDIVAGTGESGLLWLVDADQPSAALAAVAGIATSHGFLGIVDGDDLRTEVALSEDLQPIADRVKVIQVIGGTEDAGWQAEVLLRGDQLPGGGFLVLPRRLMALYGNPLTTSLGPLGEQGPDEGYERIVRISEGFDADGIEILPTFEIIATVASGSPGNDGDYSNEMEIDLLRSWVDAAERHGMYVLLDLQPGRTDFLTQAMRYEELLLEPHVGLALDPEWRLAPDEVHLQQIGQVDAPEVNSVIEWLAALTRDNALPQKVLLLHQFHPSMLENRDQIMGTPELELIIQMDGHGNIGEKMGSWIRTTEGWETDPFEYGWKLFYDEDVPGPVGPDVVLGLTPTVYYVSFQ